MGVQARASFFVEAGSVQDLTQAVEFARKSNLRWMVLGGGSNVLFRSDFDGLIIQNALMGKEISEQGDNIQIKVSGGENWHALVLHCVENGWGGIENLSLIPGSVGAAPIQNIGAYGVELQDVFAELEALTIETGEVQVFSKEQCRFGYRDSIFKKGLKGKVIITSVTLALSKSSQVNTSYKALSDHLTRANIAQPSIKDVSDAVIEIRQSKLPDPKEIGNTGSFFKNPVISVYHFDQLKSEYSELPGYPVSERQVKVPAGWLIEKAGWKGKREGDAGVHEKQALVLVNYGKATGEEIWNLATQIQRSVKKQFDIDLTPEVNIIG